MINFLELKNYRGFSQLELSDMSPITLISGKNNTGKTSVLEALFLLMDHQSPDCFVGVSSFRNMHIQAEPSSLWEPFFYNMETDNKIEIVAHCDDGNRNLTFAPDKSFIPTFDNNIPSDMLNQFTSSAKTSYSLKFEYNHETYTEVGHYLISPGGMMCNINTNLPNNEMVPMQHCQFINAMISQNDMIAPEWFGKILLSKKKEQILQALRIMEPELQDIVTISKNNRSQLYFQTNDKTLPAKMSGDGMTHLLFILMAIVTNPNAIILIDEIETGFHYSIYEKLWEIICKTAIENNCQVIVTTHSYECIVGAISAVQKTGSSDGFCFYRIDKGSNSFVSKRYNAELLQTAIELEMEVR